MDHRHVIAYFFMLLIAVGLGAAWLRASREWRASRRAHFRYEREQDERRAAAADEES